jgi:hypothetical protein
MFDRIKKHYQYRMLIYLHFIEIPICRVLHYMRLLSSDQVEALVERWTELNRKETLKIIQDKWK